VKRTLTVLALTVAATTGSLVTAGAASADPSACLHISIDLNGTGQQQDLCLPPAG
jgi:hypothetical protein